MPLPDSLADEAGLVVVHHPPASRSIVILMHGVNGHHLESWGPVGQPATFLARLQRDLPSVTISTYAYPSPLAPRNATLTTLTQGWVDTMRALVLPHYDRVAVVGHCLGGLIARFGIPTLTSGHSPWLLITLDTPENWSDAPLREPLASIVTTLGLSEPAMRANAAWWSDRPIAGLDDHAILSTQHNWVTPFKRGSTTARATSVDVPHTDLTRPPLYGDHAAYACVVKDLELHLHSAASHA